MSGKATITATAIVLTFLTSAAATECPKRSVTATKPTLRGQIEDGAKGVGLMWQSAAGQGETNGWWSIDDSICNTGTSALIVDWPKTGLANDAYTPLFPGGEIHSEFSIGPHEPVHDDVVLRYGKYTSAEAQTRVYHAPDGPQGQEKELKSRFGGVLMLAPDVTTTGDKSVVTTGKYEPPTKFEVGMDAVPEPGKGYRLIAYAKASKSIRLVLALSSAQNRVLAEAINRGGFKTDIYPIEKLVGPSKIERLRKLSVVSFPISTDGKAIEFLVPSKLSDIEEATAVLIADGKVALVAKVSLFQ